MYIQEFEAVEVLSFEEADAGGVGRPLLEWEEELLGLEKKELEI